MARSALKRGWTRSYPQFRQEDLFALVADIKSYPAFVPGCQETRVLRRGENVWLVENVFGFGPLRKRFISQATLNPPHELSVTSDSGVWRRLLLYWRFEPAEGGCRLSCEMALDFKSAVLNGIAALAVVDAERRIIAAFERRADELLGPRA